MCLGLVSLARDLSQEPKNVKRPTKIYKISTKLSAKPDKFDKIIYICYEISTRPKGLHLDEKHDIL